MQLALPSAFAMHEMLEEAADRQADAALARQDPSSPKPDDQHHHDESKCPVCQTILALSRGDGHLVTPAPPTFVPDGSPQRVEIPKAVCLPSPSLDAARARAPPDHA